ncbi:rod binding protein [Humitalea rosea]|uniref:Rod binding protein n=1 Tax=Humitalea rosea TaxID=990373 RepID=A0A2W7IGI8_9PROT|nr:rod-binding protein [Humitalea rosea]PZW45881.1 rod binding protein [Humitalea rosea]
MTIAAPITAITRVARQFEAQALGALLQPIFATVNAAAGRFGGGAPEAAWQPMLVDAIATAMAGTGGIGLASAVQAELLRAQAAQQTPETPTP